jgi:hypothetical protein
MTTYHLANIHNDIDEAFELLHQILQDTQKTNNNLIGFRPKSNNA